jgi:hypothetical protein
MNVVTLALTQDHSSLPAHDVAEAINLKGSTNLIRMAASPEHRDQVIGYRDNAVWQALHCHERGAAHEKDLWFRIAERITLALSASRHLILHEAALTQRRLSRSPS